MKLKKLELETGGPLWVNPRHVISVENGHSFGSPTPVSSVYITAYGGAEFRTVLGSPEVVAAYLNKEE
jgi:hypothetical protein